MLGAIAGDIIGSVYEHRPVKTTEFPLFQRQSRFTDDTVMTVAVGHAILERADYGASLKAFGRKYPHAGYGRRSITGYLNPVSHHTTAGAMVRLCG
jgi:ADP-ribosylglycohydrolase